MKLKDKLYNLRKKNGYTQSEIAEMLEVSRQSVSNWELGTIQPSTSRLKKLSKLYSVSLETLLDEEAEVQLHSKDIKDQESKKLEAVDLPMCSEEKDQKFYFKKRAIVIVTIVIILVIAIGISGFSIAATNAAREKAQLEELSNEEITVPSENSFDLTF